MYQIRLLQVEANFAQICIYLAHHFVDGTVLIVLHSVEQFPDDAPIDHGVQTLSVLDSWAGRICVASNVFPNVPFAKVRIH